jgi:hypothetical protein
MAIVNEWEMRHHITAALDTLHAELDSGDRDTRITCAVNLLDNCIRLLQIQVEIDSEDEDDGEDD